MNLELEAYEGELRELRALKKRIVPLVAGDIVRPIDALNMGPEAINFHAGEVKRKLEVALAETAAPFIRQTSRTDVATGEIEVTAKLYVVAPKEGAAETPRRPETREAPTDDWGARADLTL